MRKFFYLFLIVFVGFRLFSALQNPLEGKRIRVTGTLSNEPREYGTSLLVSLHGFSFFIPQDQVIQYGSKITVEGLVHGKELENIIVVSVEAPSSFLSKVRQRILENIRSAVPEPESALLAGATIGAPNIPKELKDALRKTGTSHIVVASGGNLAILAGFLELMLSRILKRKIFIPVIALILLIYSALTGFAAPIVRALIMWLVIGVAQLTGRVVRPVFILLFTILVMLIYKPLWLFEVSFQLSIGATAGILLLASRLRKLFKKVPFIREALAISIAAQIGILPISLYAFGEFNPVSPVWNTLLLWTVPYITIIGMIGSAATIIFEPIGRIIYVLSYPFCWYFVNLLSFA